MTAGREPQHVSRALSELIALRGWARARGYKELAGIWCEVAGSVIAAQTKVQGIRRGALLVGVSNAPLMSELASFHKASLLEALRRQRPDLRIQDLKFRLNGQMETGGSMQ